MSSEDYILADADDWIALYCDGELIAQGHSFDWVDVLQRQGMKIERKFAYTYAVDEGQFPTQLSEITWDDEYYVPCGCDYHGDHAGCDNSCEGHLGCHGE